MKGCYERNSIEDGELYIYTESGEFILPHFYGLYQETEKPVGVAVKAGDIEILIALKGSETPLPLLSSNQRTSFVKLCPDYYDAVDNWSGKANSAFLAKIGSPAAWFCANYECRTIKKGEWWMPSFAEMDLMNSFIRGVDCCLYLCRGEHLPRTFHWTSTLVSSEYAWAFDYGTSFSTAIRDESFYIRPITSIPK